MPGWVLGRFRWPASDPTSSPLRAHRRAATDTHGMEPARHPSSESVQGKFHRGLAKPGWLRALIARGLFGLGEEMHELRSAIPSPDPWV